VVSCRLRMTLGIQVSPNPFEMYVGRQVANDSGKLFPHFPKKVVFCVVRVPRVFYRFSWHNPDLSPGETTEWK